MLKATTFILLILAPVIFYGRGYISQWEFGNNTIYFGLTYLLYWWQALTVYILIPKEWKSWFKAFAMFVCCLFFLQVVVQVSLRSEGFQPDNNIITTIIYSAASIIITLIYIFENKWKL